MSVDRRDVSFAWFSETKGVPSETRGLPSETRGVPSETRGVPSETRGIPSETRGVPLNTSFINTRPCPLGLEKGEEGCAGSSDGYATTAPTSAPLWVCLEEGLFSW